ncbi:PIN domain-containing protein [Candidatus Woesearchaeota archaeon]|nr:PIN domain-containing protein [Candidatus Woesearchaeota archaeon]
MKYFLDTYALIEIAKGNQKYQKYLESDCVTLKDNLAELFYFLLKKYNEKIANLFIEKFSKIAIEFPIDIISKAMIFKYKNSKSNFSYIDCFGYIYAIETRIFFLTGDRAFTNFANVEIVR